MDKALEKVFSLLFESCSVCKNHEEADLIIVNDRETLQKNFNTDKFFAIFSIKEVGSLPENARWIPIIEYIVPMTEYLAQIKESISSKKTVKKNSIQTGKEFQPSEVNEKSQRILVIDDTPDNLKLAIDLLGNDHFLTLASGFDEGLELIKTNQYDVVLSDCQMLPETKKTALSIENITIGQTVHNGIFLIFHATKRGTRVAIVTDANHHMDWVSALFDDKDLREPQEVNGQPVLFINYINKRWDKALKKINAL